VPRNALLSLHSCLLFYPRRVRRCLPCPFICAVVISLARKTESSSASSRSCHCGNLFACSFLSANLRFPPFACCRLVSSHGRTELAMPTVLFLCRRPALLSASPPSVPSFLASPCGLLASATCPPSCSYNIASCGWEQDDDLQKKIIKKGHTWTEGDFGVW